MKSSSIVFIVPYFGKLPQHFQLWLNSCGNNNTIQWIIFTDDKTKYYYPKNVKVYYKEFYEIVNYIKEKLEFNVVLESAYKLCDFKPAYGYIFNEYIKEYDFWGYCDIDIIFGDIRKFINNDILNEYDKIFPRGHLSLYRNSEKMNSLFLKTLKGKYIYKDVFSTNDMCCFDERFTEFNGGINGIALENGVKLYSNDSIIADILIKYNNFIINSDSNKKKKYKSIFIYDKNLVRYIKENDNIIRKEYLYIHFQKRRMKVYNGIKDKYIIIANEFLQYNQNEIDKSFIINNSFIITHTRVEYIKIRLNRLYNKVIKLLASVGIKRF